MTRRPSTRNALLALLAGLLWAPPAGAHPSVGQVQGLVLGQISFEGLDLSDEPKKPKKKSKKKKKKAVPDSRDEGSDEGDTSSSAVGADSTTQPAADPPATDSSSGTIQLPPLSLDEVKPEPKPDPKPDPKPAEKQPVSGGLGLDLSGPAPTDKPKTAPVMTFDAVDVSGKSAERQRLDAAIKLFKEERYETAALALHEVLKDQNMAVFHDEAQYLLAKTLFRLKLYHSALNNFQKLLAKGPTSKFFKVSLEWLFYIARKTVNEGIVLEEIAKYSNYEFPERFRSEFRYLLARYHFARGKALHEAEMEEESQKSFAEAKRLVMMVCNEDAYYAKTRYLEGALLFHEGAFATSLESFKEVVRAQNPRANPEADQQLRELAFMQLARTHYGHKQNRYAIFYYDKVERGSDQWLEALFEASWAHFRIGQYERALGNLITLSSPFFKDEYFPEALILKAVIYYENCRYREARAILEEFEQTYMPVHNELEKITSTHTDAQKYYDILAEIQRRNQDGTGRGSTLLLERILKLALTDKDLKLVNDSILEIEREQDAIAERRDVFKYSDLAKKINEDLKAERQGLMGKAGILAKAKLEFELGQLKKLLGDGLRIKFETSTKEKGVLEEAMRGGAARRDELGSYKTSTAVNDERSYWPYEGEYWRDELGTYEYTLTKGCRKTKQE